MSDGLLLDNLDLDVALEPSDGRLVVVDGALDGQVPLDHLLRLFRQRFRELVFGVSLCANDAKGSYILTCPIQGKIVLATFTRRMGCNSVKYSAK